MQPLGRPPEMPFLGNGHEIAHLAQVHYATPSPMPSWAGPARSAPRSVSAAWSIQRRDGMTHK
ncbi:hypothetical protein ACFFX0_19940 [Citricoccus parietis]|uniref:Uncharacterized protein n=1 Tax=Citricoccus parietis TaxID=592307 RepID=A0ABV5G337_9MICC